MFTESAELYDAIYATFKDYPGEAKQIAELLRTLRPHCRTVLDVACGTGEHARLLAEEHGFAVDGIDLDPTFVRIASAKHPAGQFVVADMADFDLAHRYDAVLCLFSSIGYMRTLDNVVRALRCFRNHVADDGVIVVEPWFPPDVLEDGRHSVREVDVKGVHVRRTGILTIEDRISRLRFDYVIEGPDGIRETSETHTLGLFTVPQMLEAFRAAGMAAEHREHALTGRGLYVASRAGARGAAD